MMAPETLREWAKKAPCALTMNDRMVSVSVIDLYAAADAWEKDRKRLAEAEKYIVALYDGNNDIVDSAFEDLPADMQERLRRADEKIRAKYERRRAALAGEEK